jgi:hypothetical protein
MPIYKFEVGEIWETRDGDIVMIKEINSNTFPVTVTFLKKDFSLNLTPSGSEVFGYESDHDLVIRKGRKEDFPEYFL